MDDEQDYSGESEEVDPEAEIKGLACSGDTDESLTTEAEPGDDQADPSEDALVAAEPVAAVPEPPVTRAVSDTPPPPARWQTHLLQERRPFRSPDLTLSARHKQMTRGPSSLAGL